MANVNSIIEQEHEPLCWKCGREELFALVEDMDTQAKKEGKLRSLLKKFRDGLPSKVTKEHVKKYGMKFDEKHGLYSHQCKDGGERKITPWGKQPVFVTQCGACDNRVLVTVLQIHPDQQKDPHYEKYWRSLASKIGDRKPGAAQDTVTCTHCGYGGIINDLNIIVGKSKEVESDE